MTTRSRASGQSLAEFALVLPIAMLLLFALFDGGRAVIYYSELTNAARVGARVAIVNQSNDATCPTPPLRTFKCEAARQAATMGIRPADIGNLVISGANCQVSGSCAATVTMTYRYVPVTPGISALFGSLDLSASSTMPIERSYTSP
jgi:hypothetical protein